MFGDGVYALCCPHETALFICNKHDIGGVLLDCRDEPKDAEILCRKLRELYPPMPVAALCAKGYVADLPADRIIRDTDERHLDAEITDFARCNCGFRPPHFSTFYLDLSRGYRQVTYMGYPLRLEPRAYALLQVLMYRAPKMASIDELLDLCYREGQRVINLGVQIHYINQAAKKIYPRPLIESVWGKGYKIRDGIL